MTDQTNRPSFSMPVIDIHRDVQHRPITVYLRLPKSLSVVINGGCACPYCTAHPKEIPLWDTLAVPCRDANDRSWVVHHPEGRPTGQPVVVRQIK